MRPPRPLSRLSPVLAWLLLVGPLQACGDDEADKPDPTPDTSPVADVVDSGAVTDTVTAPDTVADTDPDADPAPDMVTVADSATAATADAAPAADAAAIPCDPASAGLHQVKYKVGDHAEIYAITKLVDGYALAGVAEIEGGFDGLVIRTDDTGKATWTQTFGGKGLELIYGITALPNGDMIAVGSSDSGGEGDLAWLVRVSKIGGLNWQSTLGAPGKANAFAIARSGTDLATVGWGQTDGVRRGLVALVDDGGKVKVMSVDSDNGESELAALAVDKAGITAVGRRFGPDTKNGGAWLWRLDAAGKPLQSQVYIAPAMGGTAAEAQAVASVASGGWVIGGLGPDAKGKGYVGWILRADAQGKALWSRSFADMPRVIGLAVTGKSIIGVGHHKADGVVLATWLRAGLDGTLSGVVPALATAGRLHAIVAADASRVAAVGSLDGDKGAAGWLRVATAWGDAHCDNAGKCAALALDDCLDTDPCTGDWCTVGVCDHGALPKCP